jgi:hypothetical protein
VAWREFVTKFRMRQVPLGVIIGEAVLGLGVAAFYGRAVWMAVFHPQSRALIWWGLLLVALLVVMMGFLVMGAVSLAREREAGTWSGIELSLLSERQIVDGKMRAMLGAGAVFSLPFWPLLALCLRGWRSSGEGVGLVEAAAGVAVLGATAWSFGAFGMLASRLARRSSEATILALSAMFFADVALPFLSQGRAWLLDAGGWFNPALVMMRQSTLGADAWQHAIPLLATLLVIGATCRWGLLRTVRDRPSVRAR